MPQNNDEFIINMFERLGFGDYFNDAYLAGKKAKLTDIPFVPGKLQMGSAEIAVLPKIMEDGKQGNGFYIMKGYTATRIEEGKPDASVFLPTFRTLGFTIDQANQLLTGAAIRHLSDWEDNQAVFSYSQVNFNETTARGNFKLTKRTDDGSLLKTLSKMGIIAKPQEKENIYAALQKGERVSVNVRNGDSYQQVNIQVAVRKIGFGVDVTDNQGKILKEYPEIVPNKLQPLQQSPDIKKIPEGTVKTVSATETETTKKEPKRKLS